MKTIEHDAELLNQLRTTSDTSPEVALALTAIGEARGDDKDGSSLEERVAVMCVIRNRRKPGRFGSSWSGIIFAPKQFSCWNEGDNNRALLLSFWASLTQSGTAPPARDLMALYYETRLLAQGVVDDVVLDRTGGATHYYAPAALEALGFSIPTWALGKPYKQIGSQRFFAL
jgi:N-acetylmuramoyl-L-alanine amidase